VENAVLHIEIVDDGSGGARADGTGLTGLRDRLATHNAELVVDSSPGAGTRVAATIPLEDDGPARS
jgi:two-component system sensor histidine kinase DesK